MFFQVWPPGPSHEETPLNRSRGESCGLRGVKVEEPWAEGCVFQPKHAILHPTQLPPGPHFLEGLLRANKSCKKRHSNHGAWCLGFPGLIHWYLTFWVAPKPLPWACALRMLMIGRLYAMRIYWRLYAEVNFPLFLWLILDVPCSGRAAVGVEEVGLVKGRGLQRARRRFGFWGMYQIIPWFLK